MQRASISAIAAALIGVGVVVARGGGLDAVGTGVLAGVMMGGVVGLLAHTLVSTALRHETAEAFKFVTIGFAAKAAGAILPWALLTFWAPAGAIVDPLAYLIGYAGTVLLVLGAGVLDHLRLAAILSNERAHAEDGGTPSPVSTGSSATLESTP